MRFDEAVRFATGHSYSTATGGSYSTATGGSYSTATGGSYSAKRDTRHTAAAAQPQATAAAHRARAARRWTQGSGGKLDAEPARQVDNQQRGGNATGRNGGAWQRYSNGM